MAVAATLASSWRRWCAKGLVIGGLRGLMGHSVGAVVSGLIVKGLLSRH
jgi:hypothetical protein